MTRGRGRNFVKVGTVKVYHYRSKDGRTFIDARPYGRKLVSKKDHDEALREARRIAVEINQGGVEVLALTPDDRAVYAKALSIAGEVGTDLLTFCSSTREAHQLLTPGISLLEAVRAGIAALSRSIHCTPDVVGELLTQKAARDLDGRYGRDLRHHLRDFALAFPGDIAAIEPGQIEAWLKARTNGRTGGALSNKRRSHIHANIKHLFKFARSREYLPDKITAAAKVEAENSRKGKRDIGIFAAGEIAILLKHIEEQWLPWLAISAFSGVRCEEIARSKHAADRKDVLRWTDFDWPAREICVREEVAKTGHPRRCPIPDNLFAWLSKWRDEKARGPVVEGEVDIFRDRFKRRLRKLQAESDEITARLIKWPHNALRHSYGSYRMAELQNMHALSYEMGNTEAMIKRHYNNPRPKAEAAAWFSVFPSLSEKVIQLTLPGVHHAS